MARASQRKNLVVRSLLVLGFWTLIGLSFAGQFFIASSQLGRPVSWQTALQHSLADWYVIAILSVLPLRLSARFRLDGPDWWPRFLLHLVASGCFSVLFVLIRSLVALWQPDVGMMNGGGVPVMAKTLLVKTWHFNLLIYWVILSVGHALAFYRSVQERETRTADLERRLAEARLQALQMQLNPHFLFNTLHAISALMHQDVDAADRMIARLSELLRHALESSDQHQVPLREEVEFLRRYLDIEQTRFGDRLQVTIDVPDSIADCLVPNLILQPLVENAIQHGIEPHSQPGIVRISAKADDGHLDIRVTDSGDGRNESFKEGIGLTNTRNRLEQLYGRNHTFKIANADGAGLEVVLHLPKKTAPVSQTIADSQTT